MNGNGSRWTHLCAAATTTTVLASCPWSGAHAAETHRLKPGQTLAAFAREYHTSVHAISVANHLADVNNVPDNKALVVPDGPVGRSKTVRAPARSTARRRIVLAGDKGDKISLRSGPGENRRRVALAGAGTRGLVTGTHGGWVEVVLSDGRSGWVRGDLLAYRKPRNSAQNNPPARPAGGHRRPVPVVAIVEERHRRRKQITRHKGGSGVHVARKHHEQQHPTRVAHRQHNLRRAREIAQAHRRARHEEMARAHRRHLHEQNVAHYGRQRHVASVVHRSLRSRHGGAHYVQEASMPEANTDIVRTAYSYRGTPYRWGGEGRGGFDCSGFTSYLYGRRGVALPHSARSQFGMGHHVGRGEMQPGDLVFFHTVTPGISHVGMYVGNGHFVHSSSRRSGGVRVDSLDSGYYSKAFRGARRYTK